MRLTKPKYILRSPSPIDILVWIQLPTDVPHA